MQISRGAFACGAVVAVVALAACDVLLGLGQYKDVVCIPEADCEGGAADGRVEAATDAELDTGTDAYEASVDASVDAGADADSGLADAVAVAIDAPSSLQWAQWPMPNPDASIGGDSSARLPNPMEYETGDPGDGGEASAASISVVDQVTKLVWEREGDNATAMLAGAQGHCEGLGTGWRVPTRIELVSIIDFTEVPTINQTVFINTQKAPYWTSSVFPDGGNWSVDFKDGTVGYVATPTFVRCVSGDNQ